jgi:hypothetical protein
MLNGVCTMHIVAAGGSEGGAVGTLPGLVRSGA